MTMTLNQAAKAAKKAKGTILKAIKDGTMSAPKDENGRYTIDPSELDRVFPFLDNDQSEKPELNTDTTTENRIEIERLKAELQAANKLTDVLGDQIEDLRRRLDEESSHSKKLTALITDQRPQAPAPQKRGFFARLRG